MVFLEQTLKVLTQSGWFIGREIDISETNKMLKTRGFDVFPCVEQLLREFGELEYSYLKLDGKVESFHFKPKLVLGDIMEREDYSEFEYWFNEPLVVIGEAYRRNMNMFMSESGKVYGEYGGYQLFKFGENIYEALEALCQPKPIEEIKNPSLP
ncbi:SUKH-3 immunity protein [Paenibacillus algorifonticola]|uniref:SUKH-3 immunity protein n=1 Tax=Paenibacillus algorifonticola TaxID=684063 RepID=A0A1I2BFR1_9BACL|nr:SUKH-3 domain-containing protein [Paenibacillus algorifonticola]SFE54946.1 SUKH-3 immunity protein [Paenibacillus algorifonticola]